MLNGGSVFLVVYYGDSYVCCDFILVIANPSVWHLNRR